MSARAIASVTVSFGLVTIPTKVYASGNTGSGVSFHLMHKKCGSRLKQQYYCPKDNDQVARADMVRGYEFSKGQYVLFNEDELKTLQAKSTQTVEITEFIPGAKVRARNRDARQAMRRLQRSLSHGRRCARGRVPPR